VLSGRCSCNASCPECLGTELGEIFQDERLSMDEEAAQEASEQGHPGILAGVGKSNDFRRDGVFADYG